MGPVVDPMAAVEVAATVAETAEEAEVTVVMVMVPVHSAAVVGTATIATSVASQATRLRCATADNPKKEEQAYAAQEEESSLPLTEVETSEGNLVVGGGSGDVAGGGYSPGNSRTPARETIVELCPGFTDECPSKGAQIERSGPTSGSPLKVEGGSEAAAVRPTISSKPGSARRVLHIVEEKVFAALGDEAEKEICRWVLDTGNSNHMSGC
jgi:hypothetical protein